TARAALLRAAGAEIAAAFAAHARRVLAVDEFEKQVIPTLDQSDRLLARSYQAGQITLADYLAARRELLDARTEYLQRLVEMAEASVELELAAGVIP
ncbi:MAG TPA: TolC family protein, partial [Kofleriaceae bacterium]|nr:TolC family protein [Kofleriaceae bacterium]